MKYIGSMPNTLTNILLMKPVEGDKNIKNIPTIDTVDIK